MNNNYQFYIKSILFEKGLFSCIQQEITNDMCIFYVKNVHGYE